MHAYAQKKALHFLRMIRRPHRTKHPIYIPRTALPCTSQVPGTWFMICTRHTAAVLLPPCGAGTTAVPRTYSFKAKLVSSHPNIAQHVPCRLCARSSFDPKRAATAPRCRACWASRDHNAGSLLIGTKRGLAATAAVVGVYTSCPASARCSSTTPPPPPDDR